MTVVPKDPGSWTADELRARADELSEPPIGPPNRLLTDTGRVRAKLGRDPLGDTEDLDVMDAASDRLAQAQVRLEPHAIAAAVREIGLQLSGAVGLVAVAILIAAVIIASCGGN